MIAKKTLWWSLGIAAVAGVVIFRVFASGTEEDIETVQVRRGDVTEYVSETGRVVAKEDLDLFFERSGRLDEILVVEGQEVEEDEEIMRLRMNDLFIQRQEALAGLSAARARYQQALAGATEEEVRVAERAVRDAEITLGAKRKALEDLRATNEASLEKAYSDLESGLETLYLKATSSMQILRNNVFDATGNFRSDFIITDSVAGTRAANEYGEAVAAVERMDGDITDLRLTDDRAETDVLTKRIIADGRTARSAVASSNLVLQSSIPHRITQSELDARKSAVSAAWENINASVNTAESLRLAVSNTIVSNVKTENAAEKDTLSAENAFETAKDRLDDLKASLRDVDKAVHLADIAAARANVSRIDQQIADATLEAPSAGIIGSIDIDIGELVGPGARVGTLISTALEIGSRVSELDIDKLRVGQPVVITFDALEDREFTGRVAVIAPRETEEDDDVFYDVTVDIESEDAPIRPGMTADMDIVVGEKEDVVLAPRRRVLRGRGGHYVKVLEDDGTVREVDVRVGLRGRDAYEILEGVRPGDRIVVE